MTQTGTKEVTIPDIDADENEQDDHIRGSAEMVSMSATEADWLRKSRRLLEIAMIVEQSQVEAAKLRSELAQLEQQMKAEEADPAK